MKQLYEEMAFIAHHFHWSHEELMQLDHRERRRWCDEISKINRMLDGGGGGGRSGGSLRNSSNPFEIRSRAQ